MSGYDLKRTFDSTVRHFWSADQAAIYRTLAELQDQGQVAHERIEQEARPDRKVFTITTAGLASLDSWLATSTPAAPRREPLLIKLFFARRLAPGALRALLALELENVERELGAFDAYISTMEARATSLGPAERETLVGPLITLTNGLQLGIAYRDWLQMLVDAIDNGTLTVDGMLRALRALRS